MGLPGSVLQRDLVFGVVVTAVAEVELLLAADRVVGPLVPHLVHALLIVPALALRRRAPLAAVLIAAAGLALQPLVGDQPVATGFLVLLGLLVSLGWYAAWRPGLIGVASVAVAGLVFWWSGPEPLVADLVVNLVLLVAAWAGGRGVRLAVDRAVSAEVSADRRARRAVDEERARIARDLHDSLAHTLTLMTLQAGSARERVSDAEAVDTLASIEGLGRTALEDMQRVLRLLDRAGREAPGIEDLPGLVEGVQRGGLPVTLRLPDAEVPESASAVVYRAVQEGLTNAVRHSDATAAGVEVRCEGDFVVAVVESTGVPRPSPVVGSGRGLVGLRERLASVGGSLESDATAEGWRLEARVPLRVGLP